MGALQQHPREGCFRNCGMTQLPPGWVVIFGEHGSVCKGCCLTSFQFGMLSAVIAQLAARRSHNPKVVSSILTHRRKDTGAGNVVKK